jgi:hypothetical protein
MKIEQRKELDARNWNLLDRLQCRFINKKINRIRKLYFTPISKLKFNKK